MKITQKSILLLLIVLSYWAIKPLFVSGFFPMHDDTQVARVFEMHKSLSDGMFPVRWVSDLGYGYGYPIFNFYAPLAYYIGGFIQFFFIDALTATKIMMGLGIILAEITMYFFAKQFWGRAGGLIAAALYLYAPYHALDIYVRGDIAELWAYAFIPLAFLGMYKAYVYCENPRVGGDRWIWISIGAFGYASLILSHNLTAMMVTPFLLIGTAIFYISALSRKTKRTYLILLSFFIGILLAAFYWLPVFFEMQYTNVLSQIGGGAAYKDHFVCLSQLWNSPWGFGGSTPGCIDGLSFKIGKLHILLSLFSLLALPFFWKSNKTKFAFILFSIFSLLIAVFLMLDSSKFIWDAIPHMAFFQYPWRFLILVSFFTSFLSGAIVISIRRIIHQKQIYWGSIIVLLVAIIVLNAKVFNPQTILQKSSYDYTNHFALTWTASAISDEYLPKGFSRPLGVVEVPKSKLDIKKYSVKILSFNETTQSIQAQLDAKKKTEILVNQSYFPTWHVLIDGKINEFKYFNRGLLITIPQGKHFLNITYIQTPIEKIADTVSLTGVLILILGIIAQRKEKKHAKKSA